MNLDDNKACHLEDVAAYLDGELSASASESFEAHLKTCAHCAAELRTQRQLLCTLDHAFSEPGFSLPTNFSRVVAAHAESDLSGMRNRSERRRALQTCAVLALLSFALLGATSRALVFQPVGSALRFAGSFLDLIWRTVYDAGTGIAVIVRVVGRAAILAPHGMGLLLLLPFVVALALLPRLIVKCRGVQVIE